MTCATRDRQASRRRGMTLIGMLAVMALLGTFMVLAGHLFIQSITITRDGTRLEHEVMQIDALVRHMRTDVWQATRIDAVAADHLELALSDGFAVTWQITRDEDDSSSPATHITRRATGSSDSVGSTHFTLRPPVRMESDGATVQLHVGEQQITLISPQRVMEVQP